MSKVLIISCSYRKNSNSRELAEQAAAGAREKGHDVTMTDISKLQINPCHGCEACLSGKKQCVQKDGMQELYPLLREAEAVLFAAPIYWFDMPAQMKAVIDRSFAIAVPTEEGRPSLFASKKIGALFTYGGDDVFDSGCVNAIRTLQDICSYTCATWAGAVYDTASEAGAIKSHAGALQKAKAFGASL